LDEIITTKAREENSQRQYEEHQNRILNENLLAEITSLRLREKNILKKLSWRNI
jgi:hypothetical protein